MMSKKHETKEQEAAVNRLVSPKMMKRLKEQILEKLQGEKKYRDRNYTAKQLAADLGTNHRYISVVIRTEFHSNYTSLVNKFRVEEAMSILTDWRFRDMNMEDVSDQVGFAHRQSFYTAFFKVVGTTPKAFRVRFEENNGRGKTK